MSVTRVGTNDPSVCQGNTGNGPCHYKAVPNSKFCELHGGSAAIKANQREELRNYQLNGLLAERAARLGNSTQIKSLADEIGLMRALLESIFNQLETPEHALLYSDKIEKLAKNIGDLVERWQKLQEKNKELLDREAVMRIFDKILEKVVVHLADQPDAIRVLAEEGYAIITGGSGSPMA